MVQLFWVHWRPLYRITDNPILTSCDVICDNAVGESNSCFHKEEKINGHYHTFACRICMHIPHFLILGDQVEQLDWVFCCDFGDIFCFIVRGYRILVISPLLSFHFTCCVLYRPHCLHQKGSKIHAKEEKKAMKSKRDWLQHFLS